MTSIALVMAAVAALAAGCAETCRIDLADTVEVEAATWSVATTTTATTIERLETTASASGRVSQTIHLALDPEHTYFLRFGLADTAVGSHAIDDASILTAYLGREPVFTARLTGSLDIAASSVPRCDRDDNGEHCAVDLTASALLEATSDQRYELAVSFAVDQELLTTCAGCAGLTRCD